MNTPESSVYLYFFSGSFPRFLSSHFGCYFHSPRCCHHHLPPVTGKATYQYLMCSLPPRARAHVSELHGPKGHSEQWVHTHWPSHLFCFSPGFRAAPMVSTLACCQDLLWLSPDWGHLPIVITLSVSFPDWPMMERKASDDRKQTAAQTCSLPAPLSHHTERHGETARLHRSNVPSSHPCAQPIDIGKSGPF